MFKKWKLRIALWFINTEDELKKEMMDVATGLTLEFTARVRAEYIITTKLSSKLAEEIAHCEDILRNNKANDLHMLTGEIQEVLNKKYLLQKEYTKRLFAFHGMFDAYKIRKVTPQELQ